MDSIRVLIAEDASFMRELVRDGMRAAFPGFQLDEVMNGAQAKALLEKQDYDLVLCDWEMPEMTGAELLEWLRQEPGKEQTPFIMITSRGDKEHVVKAINLGVNNFIVKPFTGDKLVNVVTKVLCKVRGVSPDQLRQLGGGRKPLGGDSAAILTRQAKKPAASTMGLSGAIPIAETAPTVKTARPKERTVVALRLSEATMPCLVRSIGQKALEGVIRRNDQLPRLMDLAVLDLEVEDEAARLNGYVSALSAREDSQESEFVNITVRLVDQDDSDKMSLLARYTESLR